MKWDCVGIVVISYKIMGSLEIQNNVTMLQSHLIHCGELTLLLISGWEPSRHCCESPSAVGQQLVLYFCT